MAHDPDDMTGQDDPAHGDVADSGPESRFVTSHGLRLHYLDWGNPGAPVLVLQHGGMDHARSWDRVARALRRDWHVIVPDLRGHGDSDWSPDGAYLMAWFAYDFAEIVRTLGDDPVTIVGHSLGGAIALRYAGLFPATVTRLVAIEGMGLSAMEAGALAATPAPDRWLAWIAARRALNGRVARRYARFEDALARLRAQFPLLPEAEARHLTTHGLRRNEDGSLRWKYDNRMRSQPPVEVIDDGLHAFWRRAACPIWLVYGRDSWATNPETDGRAAYLPDARLTMFDGAGHWVHHDRFDAFMAGLRAFLAG